MPKKLDSVNLNTSCVNLIVNYCEKADISEASFSRKFKKNNGWVTDLRRSKNLNLPSKELAVQMCLTLNVTPDDILLHEGKTPEETAKCLEDIETVRKLVEAERAKENAHDPKTVGEGKKDALIEAVRGITDKDTALAVFDELSKKMRELM